MVLYLSTLVPFLVAILCIAIVILLINSSYGRAFKAIREDEIAAEAMGINLARHKMLSFCISAFFAGVAGALFAMFANNAQAMVYTSAMTYEILLIVVIGGIGSITGSVIATFLYVACSEWWLRFLDNGVTLNSQSKIGFNLGFALVVVILAALILMYQRRKARRTKSQNRSFASVAVILAASALLLWDIWFAISPQIQLPLLHNGFRMVVFSIVIMIVALFFRRGLMGDKELTDLFKRQNRDEENMA